MDIIAKTIIEQIYYQDPTLLWELRARTTSILPESSQHEGGIEMAITTTKANLVRIELNWSDEYDIYFFYNSQLVHIFNGAHFPDLPEILKWAINK